jgi:hypothetical protein
VEEVAGGLVVRADTAGGLNVGAVVISASVSAESTWRCVDHQRFGNLCSHTVDAIAGALPIVFVSSFASPVVGGIVAGLDVGTPCWSARCEGNDVDHEPSDEVDISQQSRLGWWNYFADKGEDSNTAIGEGRCGEVCESPVVVVKAQAGLPTRTWSSEKSNCRRSRRNCERTRPSASNGRQAD